MDLTSLLVYFSLLEIVKSIENQSIDEELGSKTQFDLFENFEGCKNTNLHEEYVLQHISELRKFYTNVKNNFNGKQESKTLLSFVKENIEKIIRVQDQSLNALLNITQQSYPNIQDFQSAEKVGLLLWSQG